MENYYLPSCITGHMELLYHWSLYRPINGSQTQPIPSLNSACTIKPQSGALAADSTTAFLVAFSPVQGSYLCVACKAHYSMVIIASFWEGEHFLLKHKIDIF